MSDNSADIPETEQIVDCTIRYTQTPETGGKPHYRVECETCEAACSSPISNPRTWATAHATHAHRRPHRGLDYSDLKDLVERARPGSSTGALTPAVAACSLCGHVPEDSDA